MKLQLNPREIRLILTVPDVSGANITTKTVQGLLAMGVYQDISDDVSHFRLVLSAKGERIRKCLFDLRTLEVLK